MRHKSKSNLKNKFPFLMFLKWPIQLFNQRISYFVILKPSHSKKAGRTQTLEQNEASPGWKWANLWSKPLISKAAVLQCRPQASARLAEGAALMRHCQAERLQKSKPATGWTHPKGIWQAKWILHVLVISFKLQTIGGDNVRLKVVPTNLNKHCNLILKVTGHLDWFQKLQNLFSFTCK